MYNKIVNKNYISLIIGGIFLLIWIIFSTLENKAIIESYSSGNLQNALLQIDSILLLSIESILHAAMISYILVSLHRISAYG